MKLSNSQIKESLIKKAKQSKSTYRISAIAFDRKGDILGTTSNKINGLISLESYTEMCKNNTSRSGMGSHAELRLIKRYGVHIKTIIICRIGRGGELRPIDPCPVCKKVADKLGIKIVSIN